MKIQNITPCLWFDDQGEAAAQFYTSVFPNSRIVQIARYPEAGQEIHGKAAGLVMTVVFELDGQRFTALNGGPHFKFSEAISLQVNCETQEEIDRYWEKLSEGGSKSQCGWLKDKFGLSWQIVPESMGEFFSDHTAKGTRRAMAAMMEMTKIEIAAIERAYRG